MEHVVVMHRTKLTAIVLTVLMNFNPPRDSISKSKMLIIAPFYVAYLDTRANMGK